MKNLKDTLIFENAKNLENTVAKLKKDISENNITWWTEQYLTKLRIEQFKRGDISTDDLFNAALKKAIKKSEKSIDLILGKIDEIENAGELENLTINIEWSKSQTWGMCPTATMTDDKNRFFGEKAGGYGYDKESTALASVLNQYKPLLKLLYQTKNDNMDLSNCEVFGYGSGYGVLPYFEGGVGVCEFYKIFETIGYKLTKISSGNKFDVYTVSKL